MQITRLYLRNYRVYEHELDLAVPAGLVGVYGPNGAGKSALLESILWTLWGRSRTAKEDVRTSGVNGDCITEVEFEHEGHLFLVRRVVTGINATVKAEAWSDKLQVAAGVRDVRQYLHSVLGMDDAAFRASVFAEQKQIASFSSQTPTARRDLILRLLGITPLDVARDAARKDAKQARDDVDRVRGLLVDLDELRPRVEQARAAAESAAADAASEATAEATARQRAADAEKAFADLDEVRQEYDALVREGRAAKAEVERAREHVVALDTELAELAEAEARLAPLVEAAAGLDEAEARLRSVESYERAEAGLRRLPEATQEPPDIDEAAIEAAQAHAERVASVLASVTGERKAAEAEVARARQHLERSSGLSAEGDCPLCGQELGAAFEQVQSHRQAEVAEAEARVEALARDEHAAAREAEQVTAALKALLASAKAARAAKDTWLRANEDRRAVERALAEATAALGRPAEPGEGDRLRSDVAICRAAARDAARLEGTLARKPVATKARAEAESHAVEAESRRVVLLDKVKALAFSQDKLDRVRAERDEQRRLAEVAAKAAADARMAAERAKVQAEAEAQRLADAEVQHAALAERTDDARHLGRLADLMNSFRTSVVGTIGPRLSAQAASLFDELTDHEYDELKIDPESYEIRISDAGREYGMDRFSGSETDLANLALRVAISEQVRFQSGGAVGLLVLDEVFGPLDDDRRERMLLALERLRNRFRQILVVTHATEIKEQLPSAIEVVKLPGRRATARVIGV
ncbi:MAG TPA: SMC family ATPase [Acidimicrobiales bacterium]